MLAALWFLCDQAAGNRNYYTGPRDSMVMAFRGFWGSIGARLNPSQDWRDWPVKVIAMALLFFLPIFIWWAIKPIITATKRQ